MQNKNINQISNIKYQLLINKSESTDLEYLIDSKAFIENSNDMDDIYKRLKIII